MIDKKLIYLGLGTLSLGLTALEGCMIKNLRNRETVNSQTISAPVIRIGNQVRTNAVNFQTKMASPSILPKKQYSAFPFKQEIPFIEFHAKRVGIEPELLMAVRMAENGGKGREFGIIPGGASKRAYDKDNGYFHEGIFYPYKISGERQMAWAARTLANSLTDFEVAKRREGFRGNEFSYIKRIYSPNGVKDDPKGLNKNWEKNVGASYKRLKESS